MAVRLSTAGPTVVEPAISFASAGTPVRENTALGLFDGLFGQALSHHCEQYQRLPGIPG